MVKFIHPGIAHATERIAFVRVKIEAGQQPWFDAWQALKSPRQASLAWTPRPREHVERGAYNRPDIGSSDFSDAPRPPAPDVRAGIQPLSQP